MFNWRRYLFGFFACFFAAHTGAATLEGLYEVEIAIQNQSADERARAIRAGFHELLLRLTGTRDAANSPSATALVGKAAEFVVQYRYRLLPPTPVVPAANIPGATPPAPSTVAPPLPNADPKQVLWILYDSDAVTQALYKGRLPFWGRERPNLVVWLVIEDNDKHRQLVDATLPSPVVDAVVSRARLRGLPLTFPTLDQRDQAALTSTDAWTKQSDRITKASSRYKSDGILLGRVQAESGGHWNSRWTLFLNNGEQNWELNQDDEVIGGEIIDRIADELGHKLAQAAATENAPTATTITVTEVKNLDHYLKTLRYLESLEPVARARVLMVDGERAIYQLDLRGTPEAVARSIGASNVLVLETKSAAGAFDKESPLVYRLVP